MSFKRKFRRQLSDDPKTPAPKRDQRKGSAKNKPGSASSTRGGIKISAEAEKALERARDDLRKTSGLRAELDHARGRQLSLEAQLASTTRHVHELRAQLKDAEAERERLRTLLAGTVWYQHAM